ncbi:MAG: hypothetical protein PW790_12660 [Parvibaculaceae bacterium]|nr:hypothetical protein [Parvibaculaceae bacterium]
MHGIVGGVSSVASGGKFQAGFLAAAISDGASPMQAHTLSQLAMAEAQTAVVGGVGSVLGEGKFSDGAVTGAFGYLFNCLGHVCPDGSTPSDGVNEAFGVDALMVAGAAVLIPVAYVTM